MSDYFHEQMVNKMLEPKERNIPCKECFIFKIEEERVNQFIANYKAQRMLLRNAEIVKALEDVRAEITGNLETIIGKYDSNTKPEDMPSRKIERNNGRTEAIYIINRKIKEIEHDNS